MKRRNMMLSMLTLFPLNLLAKIRSSDAVRPGTGFVVGAGESRSGEHYRMKGVTLNVLDVKISSQDTAGDIAVFVQTGLTPKGGPPLHIHMFQDEWFYVVDGEYHFQVGTDQYRIKTGDTIFLPRNEPHAFVQLSDKGKMVVSYMPAGKIESFFKVTSEWTTPPANSEVDKVFAEHDMKVVGPPLKVE